MAEHTTGAPMPDKPAGAGQAQPAYGPPYREEPAAPQQQAPAPAGRVRAGLVGRGAALLAAGVLAGVVGVSLLTGGSSASPASGTGTVQAGAQSGATRDGSGTAPQGGLPGGRGGRGLDGETRTVGTVTAVGSGSITVRGSDGTSATYRVVSATEIARDGNQVALRDVHSGDTVLVHVLSGGVAERVLVGQVPQLPGRSQAPDGTGTGGTDSAGGTDSTGSTQT